MFDAQQVESAHGIQVGLRRYERENTVRNSLETCCAQGVIHVAPMPSVTGPLPFP